MSVTRPILSPLFRPLFRPLFSGAGSGGGFDPASLFAAGERGVWYDPSDLSTLFIDASGTSPVTADGDPVGRILDKSGNANHITQETSAARPIYRTNGSQHWLEYNEGQTMDGVFASGLMPQPNSLAIALQDNKTGTLSSSYVDGDGAGQRNFIGYQHLPDTVAITAGTMLEVVITARNDYRVLGAVYNGLSSAIRVDGAELLTGDAGTAAPGGIFVGSNYADGGYHLGKIWGLVTVNRALSPQEWTDLENHLASKAGVAL